MPRIKTTKHFAIKLIHPQFGDFYFSYFGWNKNLHQYVFVKNLSKVIKWKTIKFAEKQIRIIIDNLIENKGNVMLSFGSNVDESLKSIMIESKKKYYLPVKTLKSKNELNNSIDNINKNKIKFKEISKKFLESFIIFQNDLVSKLNLASNDKLSLCDINIDEYILDINSFTDNTNVLSEIVNDYVYDKYIVDESVKYDGVYLDIVDASHNFRSLKLKNINAIND